MNLPFGLTIRRRPPASQWLRTTEVTNSADRQDRASRVVAELLASVSAQDAPRVDTAGRDRVERVRRHRDRLLDRFDDELLVQDLLERVTQSALVQRLAEEYPTLVHETITQMRREGLFADHHGVEE